MKILVAGDLSKTRRSAHFICTNCGCVWEADKTEYTTTELHSDVEISMQCPCCGRFVTGKLGKFMDFKAVN